MPLTLLTPPALEPITLSDLKSQLGFSPIESSDHLKEQILAKRLRRWMMVARKRCENRTRRAFITQTWKLKLNGWGHHSYEYVCPQTARRGIKLPMAPFQAITSFQYIDNSGTLQTLDADGYQLDSGGDMQPARVLPPFQQPWPVLQRVPNNVIITYTAGYGDSQADVPIELQQAILFLAQFYEENGAITDQAIPRIIDNLLLPFMNRVS